MALTVKELAALAGVSVRTLHHYDAIGLLRPARVGENGYRYYEEPQLLRLQQILFFRELDFPLEAIARMLDSGAFAQSDALEDHRRLLQQRIQRLATLVGTIDKTIAHLKGGAPMAQEEFFEGFDTAQQARYEQEIRERYGACEGFEARLAESKRRVAALTKADHARIRAELEARERALATALAEGLSPDCPEVQALVRAHYEWMASFYTPSPTMFAGLGQMYCDHPDFRARYEALAPGLPEFLAQAMRIFAEELPAPS